MLEVNKSVSPAPSIKVNETTPSRAKSSVRYDPQTKRRIKVTIDENGNVTEEPVQSKIRDLKAELRKKNKDKINSRRSEKEEILKELRDKKQREASL